MRGLATRCVSKSKRRWVIQAPITPKGRKKYVDIGVATEIQPNQYRWSYGHHRGKELSLSHAHVALNEAFVVDEVTRRLET